MPSYESTGHDKVAKYLLITNHIISPEALVVSLKFWNKLDKNEQEIFLRAGAKSAVLMRQIWAEQVERALKITVKQGSHFVRINDVAPMIHRMDPLYAKYLNDPRTRQELLTIIGN